VKVASTQTKEIQIIQSSISIYKLMNITRLD